jgi:thiol-disulfide isomerase/thioredoxin
MPFALRILAPTAALSLLLTATAALPASSQQDKKDPTTRQSNQTKPPTPDEELQRTIDSAGNDRAALVRNLEAFLKKYPEAPQRLRIYRALVEASLQLRDNDRGVNYAERIVALNPDDMSMTLLTIQLLERNGDEAGLRRAVSYATRVYDFITRGTAEKSPKISQQEWESDKQRDLMTVLSLRGRLYMKLHDTAKAQADFQQSFALFPSASAAEKLGEIAELNSQLPVAITEYSRAFVLADGSKGSPDRREIRQKLGNVWRLAHGNEDGLGAAILQTFDETNAAGAHASSTNGANAANAAAKDPYEFTLRRASDGSKFPLAAEKGKVLVVNFWATWCGPCRALEPLFDRIALGFHQDGDVLFLAADCDEDESLVPAYIQEMKPQASVVFADGLDRLLGVNSFPTVVVLDRAGKIVYRAEGFGDDNFEQALTAAVQRALGTEQTPQAKSNP